MTTDSYLRQLWNIDRKIKWKIKEYESWCDIAYSSRSSFPSGEKVQTSMDGDSLENAIIRALDYKMEAWEEVRRLIDLKHGIITQIYGLKSGYAEESARDLLIQVYVEHRKLGKLAGEYSYTYNGMKKRLRKAQNVFERKYGDAYR